MRRALALARRGLGSTRPNPLVGAVVVNDGRIISQGWHQRAGEAHAEVLALKAAGAKARGATLYVTLEPCNHFGRTPPCTDFILRSGIKRVVFAAEDPNPAVCGQGARVLSDAGIAVQSGLLCAEENSLNAAWRHWVSTGKPLVSVLCVQSIEGNFLEAEEVQALWPRLLSSQPTLEILRQLAREFELLVREESLSGIDLGVKMLQPNLESLDLESLRNLTGENSPVQHLAFLGGGSWLANILSQFEVQRTTCIRLPVFAGDQKHKALGSALSERGLRLLWARKCANLALCQYEVVKR